jgi:hypothetical protein
MMPMTTGSTKQDPQVKKANTELLVEKYKNEGYLIANWDAKGKRTYGKARIGATSAFVLSKDDEGKKAGDGQCPFTVFTRYSDKLQDETHWGGYEAIPLGPIVLASGWRKDEVCGKVSEGNKVWVEVDGPVAIKTWK